MPTPPEAGPQAGPEGQDMPEGPDMPEGRDMGVADYLQFRPLMFSIAYRMTGSVSDAEDIVQEAFLRLTRALRDGAQVTSSRSSKAGWAPRPHQTPRSAPRCPIPCPWPSSSCWKA
jgi:hypothetical protein